MSRRALRTLCGVVIRIGSRSTGSCSAGNAALVPWRTDATGTCSSCRCLSFRAIMTFVLSLLVVGVFSWRTVLAIGGFVVVHGVCSIVAEIGAGITIYAVPQRVVSVGRGCPVSVVCSSGTYNATGRPSVALIRPSCTNRAEGLVSCSNNCAGLSSRAIYAQRGGLVTVRVLSGVARHTSVLGYCSIRGACLSCSAR